MHLQLQCQPQLTDERSCRLAVAAEIFLEESSDNSMNEDVKSFEESLDNSMDDEGVYNR